MSKEVCIAIEDPGQPDVHAFIDAADQWYATEYPDGEHFLVPIETLQTPDITFWVARVDGNVAGTLALKHDPADASEVKRLFVDDNYRGLGIAVSLMDALHEKALELNIPRLALETGVDQTAAQELYRKIGYTICRAFADYPDSPGHVYMEKRL